MKLINIMVVDDHQLFREGITLILENFSFINDIYQAFDGKDFITQLEQVKPDVVLMDINMPNMNGIEASKVAKSIFPNIKIIALSMHADIVYYNAILKVDADGYLLKETDSNELEKAISRVSNDQKYFSKEILQKVLEDKEVQNSNLLSINLTKREIEIIKLISEGFSNKEIGGKLYISKRTVERHRSNIQAKTKTRNSICLIMYAMKNGIINYP